MVAVERGDYEQGYSALQAAYGNGRVVLPPDGLSHFGLCIAVMEKQTRKGAELCRTAIELQFYDSVHSIEFSLGGGRSPRYFNPSRAGREAPPRSPGTPSST